ncbi:MAG: DNA-formamidopyrimidine glycosylase family protein [Gemmatimonadaceae bacterium]
MPELPDVAILADALDEALVGRRMAGAKVPQTLVLRGTPAELAAFDGQLLRSVSRRGKFLVFEFERDRIVFNPMLTGRLGLAVAGAKQWPQWAAAFHFDAADERERAKVLAARPAGLRHPWPGDADWLPQRDLGVELRYRDATRMGKIYLMPAGVARPVAGWDEQGPDADDPSLTLDEWRKRIGKYSGELKNLLRNQPFVAGIGNAYSDEILWAARLAPFRKRSSLAPDEVDALYAAVREVLPWAIAELHELVPPRLEVEQRNFLKVHRKGGEPCPRCGTRLSQVSAGGFDTTFCRGCQG